MAEKTFTEKQREIVARKMGYEGPMSMFDKYLQSTPADAQKYGLITEKFMAKGGMVSKEPRKLFVGGFIDKILNVLKYCFLRNYIFLALQFRDEVYSFN